MKLHLVPAFFGLLLFGACVFAGEWPGVSILPQETDGPSRVINCSNKDAEANIAYFKDDGRNSKMGSSSKDIPVSSRIAEMEKDNKYFTNVIFAKDNGSTTKEISFETPYIHQDLFLCEDDQENSYTLQDPQSEDDDVCVSVCGYTFVAEEEEATDEGPTYATTEGEISEYYEDDYYFPTALKQSKTSFISCTSNDQFVQFEGVDDLGYPCADESSKNEKYYVVDKINGDATHTEAFDCATIKSITTSQLETTTKSGTEEEAVLCDNNHCDIETTVYEGEVGKMLRVGGYQFDDGKSHLVTLCQEGEDLSGVEGCEECVGET